VASQHCLHLRSYVYASRGGPHSNRAIVRDPRPDSAEHPAGIGQGFVYVAVYSLIDPSSDWLSVGEALEQQPGL
jgi:hypothetical protein